MGTGKLRISQCMIVKNEEKNIKRALSWGKGLMWEQIVVDTGSTDQTVEIAKRMGAKIFHFTWIDDFAAAKNFAIEQASGDWIAFLDADEYMLPDDANRLPAMIKKARKLGAEILGTFWLQVGDTQMVNTAARQYRIFKNTPKIRYDEPIHEQLLYGKRSISGHVLNASELSIYHTGYISELTEQKSRRNIRILMREYEKRSEDPNVMGYLGDAYKGLTEEKEKAEYWYKKALPYIFKPGKKSDRDIYTVARLMVILCKKGIEKETELMEIYHKTIQYFDGFYDPDYVVGIFYAQMRQFQKGEYHLERAVNMFEQYGTNVFNPLMPSDIPNTWWTLAFCYYMNGRMEKSVNCCVNLLTVDKTRTETLEILLRCFKNEEPQAVVSFLQKLYNINDISDRVVMLSGAMRAGEAGAEVLNVLRQYCTEEELKVLERRTGKNIDETENNE